MAALDFGMALARGMLPKSEKAQKDLMNLAGGRNIFKSEDWWNAQVDKQIEEGVRKQEAATAYRMPSGKYQTGVRREASPGYYASMMGQSPSITYEPPKGAVVTGTKIVGSPGIVSGLFSYAEAPVYDTKPTTAFLEDRKYFTSGELSDIEAGAKAGAKRAKREAEAAKKSSKRARRGTSGLAGKARPVGSKAVTGLPELGSGGLQIGETTLGKGLLV